MIARTRKLRQENLDRITISGQDKGDRTVGTGLLGQVRLNRLADRSAWTGQPGRVSLNDSKAGYIGQNNRD